jgi:hypothetical protein
MPVSYIDMSTGVSQSAKEKLVKELRDAIEEAWPIGDTRILLREWPYQSVSQDGRIEERPMRPIVSLEVPPDLPVDRKHVLLRRMTAAIAEACNIEPEEIRRPDGSRVKTNWVLTFFREYPLGQAALDDVLAIDNPTVLEAVGTSAL